MVVEKTEVFIEKLTNLHQLKEKKIYLFPLPLPTPINNGIRKYQEIAKTITVSDTPAYSLVGVALTRYMHPPPLFVKV